MYHRQVVSVPTASVLSERDIQDRLPGSGSRSGLSLAGLDDMPDFDDVKETIRALGRVHRTSTCSSEEEDSSRAAGWLTVRRGVRGNETGETMLTKSRH